LIQLASDYPVVPFIAGHAGAGTWRSLLDRKDIPNNLYVDVSAWQARLAEPEALAADLEALSRLLPDRVLFGTDSPFCGYGPVADQKWVDGLRHILVERRVALGSFFANRVLREISQVGRGIEAP
jgi:predicted TIM-barrel fold metal-dependent hydrolase